MVPNNSSEKAVLKYSEKMVSVNLLPGNPRHTLIPRKNIVIALAVISIMLKS